MSLVTPFKSNGNLICNFSQEIKDALSKFWCLDTFTTPTKMFTRDEQICEDSFIENAVRLDSGRFQVQMPLRESPAVLGDSFSLAKRCFFLILFFFKFFFKKALSKTATIKRNVS